MIMIEKLVMFCAPLHQAAATTASPAAAAAPHARAEVDADDEFEFRRLGLLLQ
jgi:hypothetical protein